MQRASKESRAVLGVLSERYLQSQYTEDEWTAALKDRKLFLARIGGDWPEGIIGTQIAVDLVGVEERDASTRLLEAAARVLDRLAGGTGRAKPSTAPAFPRPARERPVSSRGAFPGSSRIRHLPRARNPNFTGRERELRTMSDALARGERVALTGLGGLGKSQLAAEYAHAQASQYEVVWWVRSEEDTTLLEDLARLAGALGVGPSDATDLAEAADAARRSLEARADWLLIFDNARSAGALRPHLPDDQGHVIVTSRSSAWRQVARPLELPILATEDAARFLRTRSGDADRAGASVALAEELGCLPLALEQAAAYVEETESTLASYASAFRQHHRDLLQQGVPADYPASVATTWELSFQAVERESPAAAQLLELIAFFSPDAIPIQLLDAHPETLPEPLARFVASRVEFDREVARPLLRFAFVDRLGDDLVVHRLVQTIIRSRIAPERRVERAAEASALLLASAEFDELEIARWDSAGRVVPHAIAVATHAVDVGTASRAAGDLFTFAARYLRIRGQYRDSVALFEQALKTFEGVFGRDHVVVAAAAMNLGIALSEVREHERARKMLERAIAIDERTYGRGDPEVARDLMALGDVLLRLGDLPTAQATYARASTIFEAKFGPNDFSVAASVNGLGNVLRALGDLRGALAAYERARELTERTLGANHPQVAACSLNVGGVLHGLGELADARTACERALAIDEGVYGPDHPEVATDLVELARILVDLEESGAARAAYQRALRIMEGAKSADETTQPSEHRQRHRRHTE